LDQRLDPAAAMRTYHDQIAAFGRRSFEDRSKWSRMRSPLRLARKICGASHFDDLRKNLLGFLFEGVLHMAETA
jgi:hypothetical protein